MSETSSQIRGEHQETQSVQSVNLQSAGQVNTTQSHQQQNQQQQQQQRSSSQAERSERSARNGGGRQRIQRSSSTTSSSSQSDGREHRSGHGSAAAVNSQGVFQNTNYSQGNASGSQGSFVSGERRQGRYRRQVIRLPDQAQGQVRQVRQRLPTPEPDTIERVYIQRTAGEVVEEITEIPMTPPPRIQERTVVEPAGPAQVIKRVIRVPPRGGHYQQGQAATNIQGSSVSVGTESYAQNQQVNGVINYPQPQYQHQQQQQQQQQPFIPQVNQNVYQGPTTNFQFPANTAGPAFPSQPVQPPAGCHPAFCFYV